MNHSDDVLISLRATCRGAGAECCNDCLPCDAANEIEQLRNDMAFQARVISRHYDQFRELHKELERLRQNPNTIISDNWLAELLNGCISHFSFDVSSRRVDISFNLSTEQAQRLWEAVQAGRTTDGH